MSGWIIQLLTIFNINIILTSSNSPPKILGARHAHKFVKAGTDVRLSCPVKNLDDVMFEWEKDGQPINHVFESRFHYPRKGSKLKIQSTIVEDTGKYICKAVNGFGEDKIFIMLIVTDDSKDPESFVGNGVGEKPKFDDLDKMKRKSKLSTPAGSTVKLKCKASGNPQPKIIWLKGDEIVPESESPSNQKVRFTLRLANVKAPDTGDYTCYVYNNLDSINFTYSLEVIEPINSKPEILPPHPSNVSVMFGSTASFQCRITSVDKPNIKWLKKIDPKLRPKPNNTINVQGNELVVLKSNEVVHTGKSTYLSKLVLHHVSSQDSGMYICLGTNNAGVDYKKAFLTVSVPKGTAKDRPYNRNRNREPTRRRSNSEKGNKYRNIDNHVNTVVDRHPDQEGEGDPSSSSSLVIMITIPSIAGLIIIILLIYLYLHRRKRAEAMASSKRTIQRVPFPPSLSDKDSSGCPQAHHAYQPPREHFTAHFRPNNSADLYSDISSASQTRPSHNSHSNGLLQPSHGHQSYPHHIASPQYISPYHHNQQQLHYNF